MDEGQDHHHSCDLGDLCQSLKLITQHQRSFAQFMTSRRKSVFDPNFHLYRVGYHTVDRVQDLRSLVWQDNGSGICGKGCNDILVRSIRRSRK